MKIDTNEQHVRGSHGLQQTQAFRIKASAHAFRMLSSGLYSDKVGAVLREIGCNAFDAHVETGTPDRPIEVKLPNRVDSQFYIRDHGPGLSHDDVMTLYTTYFESTKQSSNDFTGAFGLGSKSPFSYTDSFSVTSVHGGKKRTYSAYLDNHGSPTVSLLTTEDASAGWEHGVEVGFPVKPGDYGEFQAKAQQVFQWFRVLPKVEGATAIRPAEYARDEGEFAKMSTGDGQVSAVMGNVRYPVESDQVNGLSPLGRWAFNLGNIVLRVPIGELQVAANREALQYDAATCAALSRRLSQAVKAVADDVATKLRAFATANWKDRCDAKNIESVWGNYLNWHGLLQVAGLHDADALWEVMRDRSVTMPVAAGSKTLCRIISPSHNAKVSWKVVRDGKVKDRGPASVRLLHKTAVYHGKATHALARARSKVLSGDVEQLILLVGESGDVRPELAELRKALKGVPVHDVSTIPVPPDALQRSGAGKRRGGTSATAPLPSIRVKVLDSLGTLAEHDLPSLKERHYMCRTPSYQYQYHKGVRLFKEHADRDERFYWQDWCDMWVAYTALQRKLAIPGERAMPLLTAEQIRSAGLPKRGWKSTHEVVKEWVLDKKVRDAVIAQAAKWHPTLRIQPHNSSSWLGELAWMARDQTPHFDKIAPVLDASPLKLASAVRDIVAASAKAGAHAGDKGPAVVSQFSTLTSFFGAPPLTAVGQRGYLRPSELDDQIRATHPVVGLFTPAHLWGVAKDQPARLVEFAKLVFST